MGAIRTVGIAALAASLAPAIAGAASSAMLAVDYLRPVPAFCAEGSGCDALRQTAVAAPLGVPLPLVGLAGFVALGLASLLPGRRARVARLALGAGAALVGAMLLAVQLGVRRFCPYCTVADVSGVAGGLVAVWRARAATAGPSWPRSAAGVALLAGAGVVPFVVGLRAVPAAIRAEIARTPPGKVTVVDFVDFECPYCRMTHAALAPLLRSHADRLRVARRQVPLRSHEHALDASRAACCGERLGAGDALADALFAAPVEELTPQGCEKLAAGVGVAIEPYRACVADPRTDESIEADRAEFKAAGGRALPTIWIGKVQLVGAQPAEALEKALTDALANAGS